ncbi:MAG TPA: hypothetical protein VKB38_11265 [Terracidiphilus sp.]|nr:hypothetical protein [Terracidiphilus sp.]
MREFLCSVGIDPGILILYSSGNGLPELIEIDGCVLLSAEYLKSTAINLSQFPDRTGYECFVNRAHLRGSTKSEFEEAFKQAAAIRAALIRFREDKFQVIVSISNGDVTLRFHKKRANEQWLDDDLDHYRHEAVMAIDVPD